MKILIIYKSYHHQNTYRLVKHLKDKFDFEIINVDELEKDFNFIRYDVIGLASGLYGFEFHKDILNLANSKKIENKKVFLLFTSCMDKESFASSIKKDLIKNGNEILGAYHTKGFCTFGPLKLFGGVNKNKPNETDFASLDLFIDKHLNKKNL